MSTGLKFIASVIENGAGNAVMGVEPDLFIDDQEKAVFDFVHGYYRSYREVPTAGIVQENTGVRLPRSAGALDFHIANLEDRFTFELLREGYADFREAMAGGLPDPAIDVIEHTIRRVRRTRRKGTLIDIGQGLDEVTARLRRVQGMGGLSGVPTPWDTMNTITAGWQKGDLITWVGRTSLGKTQTLLAQAEHAFECGYSVLFVTTEMPSEQIARRWIAMRMGLSPQALKSGMISTRLLRRIEAYNASLLGRERFRLLSIGTGAKMTAIDAAADEVSPDIIFIDGAYLMKPTGSGGRSQVETVSAVFDEIKQHTIDHNIPYVVNTQFNRQAGRGGVDGTLETIGMSDTIARHSSVVIAVKPGPTENPMLSRELELLKGREGEQGSVMINYLFKPTNLSELTEEQLAAIQAHGPSLGADGEWN